MEAIYFFIGVVIPIATGIVGFHVGCKSTEQDAVDHGVGKFYTSDGKEKFRWVCETSGRDEE